MLVDSAGGLARTCGGRGQLVRAGPRRFVLPGSIVHQISGIGAKKSVGQLDPRAAIGHRPVTESSEASFRPMFCVDLAKRTASGGAAASKITQALVPTVLHGNAYHSASRNKPRDHELGLISSLRVRPSEWLLLFELPLLTPRHYDKRQDSHLVLARVVCDHRDLSRRGIKSVNTQGAAGGVVAEQRMSWTWCGSFQQICPRI